MLKMLINTITKPHVKMRSICRPTSSYFSFLYCIVRFGLEFGLGIGLEVSKSVLGKDLS